ncbi:haloalkane dehalogenase-like [Lepeophtheirus salmonis]|uniref:haloalkane dehalogenase-like n=1 Tax=Lepeophtheirus salmonis TaxID=72036 RepID=UPI003AF3563E
MESQNEVLLLNDPTIVFIRSLDLSILDVLAGMFVLFLTLLLNIIIKLAIKRQDITQISYETVPYLPQNFKDIEGYNFPEYVIEFRFTKQRMHFLDMGDRSGKVVLCLHGVPFWSHSFRKIIPGLVSAGYRVIAPDLIGFGKSDKFVDYRAYSLDSQIGQLEVLMRHIILSSSEIFLVGHNWGALLGAILVSRNPKRFSKFTIMNTNNLPDGELDLARRFHHDIYDFSRYLIMDSYFLLFRLYSFIFGSILPPEILFFAMNPKYTKEDYKGFIAPFKNKNERAGIVSYPQLVPVYGNHVNAEHFALARRVLKYGWKKPTQIIFSEKASVPFFQRGDFIVGNRKDFFTQLIPHAVVAVPPVPGGHVIMYDNPKGVLKHLIPFLDDEDY